MDAISIGQTISALRRKAGLTQTALAEKLHISAKTVSKWENGQGYPEITQFPALANVFGVSVDYLMTGQRKGIVFAGNIIADIVKTVDCYPEIGMLANITAVSRAIGGSVPNTAVDVARIDRRVPLAACGRVGDDENGQFVVGQMNRYGIDTTRVLTDKTLPTAFSDVISLSTGERTFFTTGGANAVFSPEDVDLSTMQAAILHIGYILLLDKFDQPDEEYGTVMARFLHDVQARGIKTSFDVVSNSVADYKKTILPVLKYCDYCIINEVESSRVSDLSPYKEDGSLDVENIRKTMQLLADGGVKEKVVVHCKEAGFCLDVATGKFTAVPSLAIPKEKICGSVGAGDAYCAGCLYSLYNGYEDQYMLEFASAVAGSSLFADNSTDGVLTKEELEQMLKTSGRLDIPALKDYQ